MSSVPARDGHAAQEGRRRRRLTARPTPADHDESHYSRNPRTRPQSTLNNHGKQVQDRRGEAKAQILIAGRPPLHAVRPSAGCVPEVWYLPNLLPQVGGPGVHPGRQEGELVIEADYRWMSDPTQNTDEPDFRLDLDKGPC